MLSLLAMATASLMGAAQDPDASPGFDVWGNQVGADFYTRFVADCDTFSHRHGRNAAWGLWDMPLFAVEDDGGRPSSTSPAGILTLRCIDGTDCMRSGALETAETPLGAHVLTFGTLADAQAFSARLRDLRTTCKPRSP